MQIHEKQNKTTLSMLFRNRKASGTGQQDHNQVRRQGQAHPGTAGHQAGGEAGHIGRWSISGS